MNDEQATHLINAVTHILEAFSLMRSSSVVPSTEAVFYEQVLGHARAELAKAKPTMAVSP